MAELRERYPKAEQRCKQEIYDHAMGPGSLYLAERLADNLALEPGMRVLDLGCGKAITSIFLAQDYGVQVVAADDWISPDESWQRIIAAGCQASVLPISLEAHDIPFAAGYFDRIFALNSYHYFGTDDCYLRQLLPYLAPEGLLGIAAACYTQEIDHETPAHLAVQYRDDASSLHSPTWWRRHLTREGLTELICQEVPQDGYQLWLDYLEHIPYRAGELDGSAEQHPETVMILADEGRYLTHHLIVLRKLPEQAEEHGEHGEHRA